jgi:putative protease
MLKEDGISEAVASFELSSKAIKHLKPHIDIGALAYGYIPLMMTRACPVKNIKGCSECGQNGGVLKDRTGREMLVKCRGTVSEIYNCVPLCANLSNGDFDSLSFLLYYFTIENSNQIKSILTANEPVKVNSFTRGLYKSGVI